VKSVVEILEAKVSAVMAELSGQALRPGSPAYDLPGQAGQALRPGSGQGGCAALVGAATDARFGDYQANGVMGLAKQLKTNPRKLAEQVVEKLDVSDICEQPEVAGPGFINFRLRPAFVAWRLLEINKDADRLGIDKVGRSETIVVDFSGPNIAKQMHVGHLRSTIIGDCICRLLEFLDHKVIRQNHIGDWGTQFGMLIERLKEELEEFEHTPEWQWTAGPLADVETFYRQASERYSNDIEFAKKARGAVASLHSGDRKCLELWRWIVAESTKHYQHVYRFLEVGLKGSDIRGESFYRDMLADVVGELKKKGLAVESEGAVCVFPEGFKNKEGEPLPLIVQKSDGAYLYATTDLAAIRYRVGELKAEKIIYVTDARQGLHFEMVFAVARMAGWAKPETELVHVTFGSVLGENDKPLKTREGENVKLKELLDEAVERARGVVDEKNPDLPAEKKGRIARAVGVGAVKYADYCNNRTSDYVFSFDKMLAMDGNTAPYMQYAYARIKSIERKAESKDVDIETELADVKELDLSEAAELDLAKHLIRYGEAIGVAVSDYRPNYLTSYLYELAQRFSVFYTNCPVLDAGPGKRPTRLLLCDLTARTIRHGLEQLLGIEVVEQM